MLTHESPTRDKSLSPPAARRPTTGPSTRRHQPNNRPLRRAFRSAPVSAVAPFQYGELLWGALIGLAVWGELPGWRTWTGAAVIIASGLVLIWRESRTRTNLRR